MVFSSFVFLFLFLPIVLYIYYNIPITARNFFLLCASLVFYAWGEGVFITIMIISIVLNYLFGLAVERFKEHQKKILSVAVISNLGLLAFFKYANFIVDNINILLTNINISPITLHPIHLPIGISFFTFQALSYIIDIYRKEHAAQTNFFNSALYITLFPQLIAGPIVRYNTIADQLEKRKLTKTRFIYGLERFVIGLGKKVIIGNPLAEIADKVFEIPLDQLSTSISWFGVLCWGIHLYFDFSGYSDMAIGLGKMFGFSFLENFNYPYISRSIREYWTRWHISLSTWLKDYLYIPLGGSRKGNVRTYINLVTVFFLCGLWHGAAWNFVVFGLLQGFIMVIERLGFEKFIESLWKPIGHIYFIITILLTYAIFRSETVSQGFALLSAMIGFDAEYSTFSVSSFLDWKVTITIIVGILGSLPLFKSLKNMIMQRNIYSQFQLPFTVMYCTIVSSIFVLSCFLLMQGEYNPFVYFRF